MAPDRDCAPAVRVKPPVPAMLPENASAAFDRFSTKPPLVTPPLPDRETMDFAAPRVRVPLSTTLAELAIVPVAFRVRLAPELIVVMPV